MVKVECGGCKAVRYAVVHGVHAAGVRYQPVVAAMGWPLMLLDRNKQIPLLCVSGSAVPQARVADAGPQIHLPDTETRHKA